MDTTVAVVYGSYTLEYNCHIRTTTSIVEVVPLIFEQIILQLILSAYEMKGVWLMGKTDHGTHKFKYELSLTISG